jgi:hypothetical protein
MLPESIPNGGDKTCCKCVIREPKEQATLPNPWKLKKGANPPLKIILTSHKARPISQGERLHNTTH